MRTDLTIRASFNIFRHILVFYNGGKLAKIHSLSWKSWSSRIGNWLVSLLGWRKFCFLISRVDSWILDYFRCSEEIFHFEVSFLAPGFSTNLIFAWLQPMTTVYETIIFRFGVRISWKVYSANFQIRFFQFVSSIWSQKKQKFFQMIAYYKQ